MSDAYIVDGVRTPVGSLGGMLSDVRADDLAAHVVAALVARHPNLDPARIARAAVPTASMPDAHRRLSVMPGMLCGRPASSSAMRATLRLSSPA